MMNRYRKRVLSGLSKCIDLCDDVGSVLDFGAGDGWFAKNIKLHGEIKAVDVKIRDNLFYQVEKIEPTSPFTLSFDDESFDLVYSVDVLHHCDNPMECLSELARVSSKYILIKDHNYKTTLGYLLLSILDELGNRKFGIPSNYKYQKNWEWHNSLLESGWELVDFQYPHKSHSGILGFFTNNLQYIALYKRG